MRIRTAKTINESSKPLRRSGRLDQGLLLITILVIGCATIAFHAHTVVHKSIANLEATAFTSHGQTNDHQSLPTDENSKTREEKEERISRGYLFSSLRQSALQHYLTLHQLCSSALSHVRSVICYSLDYSAFLLSPEKVFIALLGDLSPPQTV